MVKAVCILFLTGRASLSDAAGVRNGDDGTNNKYSLEDLQRKYEDGLARIEGGLARIEEMKADLEMSGRRLCTCNTGEKTEAEIAAEQAEQARQLAEARKFWVNDFASRHKKSLFCFVLYLATVVYCSHPNFPSHRTQTARDDETTTREYAKCA